MNENTFFLSVQEILKKDKRYPFEAYVFVREALDFSTRLFSKSKSAQNRHLSGQQLLKGIRAYALEQYGPMSRRVLSHWGISRTEDFGEIVFNLVDHKVLGHTEEDSKEDFANGYDFDEAFVTPYEPQTPLELLRKKNNRSKSQKKGDTKENE